MIWIVVLVFAAVYLGMILGRIPGLALDRTGIALLGAIVLLASGSIATTDLYQAVDLQTIALLFGLMILSAQFRLAGTYSFLVRAIGKQAFRPPQLLAMILIMTAVLSAVLINDIVCLAVTPVVIEICQRRRLDAIPFLLGVACSSNIGSAATLIGNPQNILIGQTLELSFSGYLLASLVPVVTSLLVLWALLRVQYKNRWQREYENREITAPPFSHWQTIKGSTLTIILLFIFLEGTLPRDVTVLTVAALLLCSRRMRSREILGIVDWQLLVLFISLFMVTFSFRQYGALNAINEWILNLGVDLQSLEWLFVVSAGLSNVVSNVPAVMLLLPFAEHPMAGSVLALTSTFAGNLLVVGSIANIIVIDQAGRMGVNISWKQHARTGIPVTIVSLIMAGLWLWLTA